ncbi:MAG: AAA family ATPase [Thermoleophilia bacterium]|nr:AAA family ATPase [Thermoleophilia bacterium]
MTDQLAPARDLALSPLSPLALHVRRAAGSLVGRAAEVSAVRQELAAAKAGHLAALTFEGEAGVGKTRLLLTAAELAAGEGFAPVAVTADEEIRGPFLLARALLASPAATELAAGTDAEEPLRVAVEALSGRDDPALATLSPDQKLLRVFDLAALAVHALASVRPLALLVDDLQWADEDSVRLVRYVVRSDASLPVLLVLASRPHELSLVTEATNLVADMERMGVVRRLRLARFTQLESAELLAQALGAAVDPQTAATMHAQAEGVGFILEELARSYRESGLVQQIDGVWKLARGGERLMPSAVKTLIQRRAARVPAETRSTLAEAAIVGRSFSLRDLRAVKVELRDADEDCSPTRLAETLAPAVAAGLLVEHAPGSPADYTFTHDQIRHFASASLPPPRRRAIHAAIVEMLGGDGEPLPESLPLLAHHALAAGDAERAARFSILAARAALAARAPEEVLRLVEQALPAASAAQDRVALLTAQDDALDMLRRAADRLDGLAELGALAEALGDLHLELGVLLRRAAARRLSGEDELAGELAGRVRSLAAERGDRRAELAACLELGQTLLRSPLGESFSPVASEVDLDGAAEAFGCACRLAGELGDVGALAAATRELGVIDAGRARAVIIARASGDPLEFARRAAAGESPQEIIGADAFALVESATRRYQRAAELFEEVGDRRGVTSTIIALAYANLGVGIHLYGSGRRIEEIRRVSQQLELLGRGSERAAAEAQMLYGVHVFARAKIVPDLALSHGERAYEKARVLGDRSLEFALACGLALTHLELGDVEAADEWVACAAAVAAAAPTALRARQLETTRGMVCAAKGERDGLRRHLERAVALATEQRRPAARCEALAQLALQAARLGGATNDQDLLAVGERSAREAVELAARLPGHPPYAAHAEAARADIALARGDAAAAAEAARRALRELAAGRREDLMLEVLLPAGRALLAGGSSEESRSTREELRTIGAIIAQRILDDDIRVRWFRGPVGRRLSALAGVAEPAAAGSPDGDGGGPAARDEEDRLLWLVVEGRTNAEIARELGVAEQDVVRRLTEMYARLGVSSRAGAALVAFRRGDG